MAEIILLANKKNECGLQNLHVPSKFNSYIEIVWQERNAQKKFKKIPHGAE